MVNIRSFNGSLYCYIYVSLALQEGAIKIQVER